MNNTFEIIPLDTWFFRGSTPMESGMMNVVSVFPPPVSVIKGAFWTARCDAKYTAESDIKKKYSQDLIDGNIPFEVTGIFLKKKCDDNKVRFYVPAPALWYYDSDKKIKTGYKMEGITKISAKQNETLNSLGMKSSAGNVMYVKSENDPVSLSGSWISTDFIENPKNMFGKYDVLFNTDVFSNENRTNVALDINKKAKDGQLFSSSHIRLKSDITLVVQFDKEIELPESGKFFFGGEKRISEYKETTLGDFSGKDEGLYFSLVPVEATEDSLKSLVTGGKIYSLAGWDLVKKFHKPTTNWIPAGAVFSKRVNNSCVAITQ